MKQYDFDQPIDRHGSGAIKCDMLSAYYGREDLLPMWVADMDFATPDFILDALRQRLEHPVLGYTTTPESYWQAVIEWTEKRHGWQIEREWLCYIPGIVKGIAMAINALTKPGDRIVIQPPVYHPFRITTESNGRVVVNNPLIELPEGGYRMDFEQLEEVAKRGCKLLILSNPHNPAGIVWDRESLQRLASICHQHGMVVISDEIHCDMALFGHRHIPFATVSEEAAACSVTFAAPSKTFNMAGVVSSYAIVPNEELRHRLFSWIEANEFGAPHLFAPIATEAAYRQGEAWREQMLRYVEQNVELTADFVARHIPKIKVWKPQASFLVWLDCRALGIDQAALNELFVNRARLALNDGAMFGREGEGFMRLNVGTPRATLQEALTRLADAVAELPL